MRKSLTNEKENNNENAGAAKRIGGGAAAATSKSPVKRSKKGAAATAAVAAAFAADEEAAAAAAENNVTVDASLPRNDGKEALPAGHPAITPFDPSAVSSNNTKREKSDRAAALRVSWDAELGAAGPAASASPLRGRRGAWASSSAGSSPARSPARRAAASKSPVPNNRSRTPPPRSAPAAASRSPARKSPVRRPLISQVAVAWEHEQQQQQQQQQQHQYAMPSHTAPSHPAYAGGGVNHGQTLMPGAFAERLCALEQKCVARETYWQGVVREVGPAVNMCCIHILALIL
jgi:hypothetical protein